jgi:hypothetical protein
MSSSSELASKLSDVLEYIREKDIPSDIYLKCCNQLQKIFNKVDENRIIRTLNYNTKIIFPLGLIITIIKRDICSGSINDVITYKINDEIKALESGMFYSMMISYIKNYNVKIYYDNNMDLPIEVDDWSEYKKRYAEIEKDSCRCSWDENIYECQSEHNNFSDSEILNYLLAIG